MIFINDKEYSYPEQKKLISVLQELDLVTLQGIAVAINNIVIPKAEWDNYPIKDDDKIIIIKAAQGG
ncbi:MAG: sulfur carrier protein ThiS [Bacteroidetes bacterium]|nr:sulfur carrier protein ThiS [Bacteroidota bacterium]